MVYQPAAPTKMGGSKCYPLFIGGADLEHGMTESSMKPMSCNSLKCFKCDKKVHRFVNGSWHQSTDYLFVRNFNTNIEELKKGVMFNPGSSAYACQCKFLSVDKLDSNKAEEMDWMCGGH